MKHIFSVLAVVLVIASIVLLSSCSKKTTQVKEDTILSEGTIEVAESDMNTISMYDEEEGYVVFDDPSPKIKNLKPGEILVGGISVKTPNGFLLKVVDVVEDDDQIIIETEQATIDEAFEDLVFSIDHTITATDIRDVKVLEEGVRCSNIGSKDAFLHFDVEDLELLNGLFFNGSIELEPQIHFEIIRHNFRFEKVDFSIDYEKRTTMELSGIVLGNTFEWDKELARLYCAPIMAGPIVITPIITLNVSGSLSVSAQLTTSVETVENTVSGIKYENNNWTTYGDSSRSHDFVPLDVTANINAHAGLGPKLSMLLYGIIGLWSDLEAFMELDVNVLGSPWWVLYGGVDTHMGCEAEIFGKEIFNYSSPVLVGIKDVIAQADGEISGSLRGTVKNAVNNEPLSDVNIDIYKSNSSVTEYTTTTDARGEYAIDLPARHTYKVIFSKPGYISAEYLNVQVAAFSNTYLESVLQIEEIYEGYGSIYGYVYNALNGFGVDSVTLRIRNGINNTTGEILFTSSTDPHGYYSFADIYTGNYTIEASKDAYNTTSFNVVCVAGENMGNQNCVISPELDSSELRIVLTWGEHPRDLDSHLTGPVPDSDSRFHVYYANKRFNHGGQTYAELDLDDVSSYGPETVTIYHQTSGMYRYSVHDYTNRNSTQSYHLSNSSAQIKVWLGNDLLHTFNVPTNTIGNVWRVFEIYGNTIVPINSLSNSTEYKNDDDIDFYLLDEK